MDSLYIVASPFAPTPQICFFSPKALFAGVRQFTFMEKKRDNKLGRKLQHQHSKCYNQLKVQQLNCIHQGYLKEKENKWLEDVAWLPS